MHFRRISRFGQILAAILAITAAPTYASANLVVTCKISGVIDEGVAVVVKRAVAEAELRGAKAIIFRVDTPGGRVDSAIQIATAIQDTKIQTIAYIEGMGAISAGALISYSCDSMIMTPGSTIGAATPVMPTPEGMEPLGEKETSFVRAKMRALAESNGYNPDIAQAMVDKDIELRGFKQEDGTLRIYAITHEPSSDEDQGELVKPPSSPIERALRDVAPALPQPGATKEATEPSQPEEPPAGTVVEPGTVVFEDGSELILPRGKLLTLTPQEALRLGLVPEIMDSLDEVAVYYDLGDVEYVEVVATWSEKLFRWLTSPTIAGLLMLLAIGGLYFEVQTPGFGLPGIVGISCLVLLLGSHYVVGLADVIDLVLILSGLILIALEAFVFPGFGVAGAAGIIALIAGLYLSLVDFTFPEYSWQFDRLGEVVYSFGIAIGLFTVLAIATWRFMPRAAFANWLVLEGTQQRDAGYTVQTEDKIREAIGLEGVATSMLRPAGRGRFGKKTYQIVTRGDYFEPGTPVKIVEVEGNRYVVDRIKETSSS